MMLVQFPTAAHMFLFPTLLNSNIGDVAGKESIAIPKIILEWQAAGWALKGGNVQSSNPKPVHLNSDFQRGDWWLI